MSDHSVAAQFGYFGKVPSRGDFIQDGLPVRFVESWAEWLQAVTAVSREQVGDAWLDLYLTSPVWHFALSPRICGDSAVAGTLMPSVDSVGRHYYFTIAAEIDTYPVACWANREWSQHSEQKILKLLDDDTDVSRWAVTLRDANWLSWPADPETTPPIQSQGQGPLVISAEAALTEIQLLHHSYRQHHDRYCFWWTSGSERLGPTTLVTNGLPLVSQFSAMLDGHWEQRGW